MWKLVALILCLLCTPAMAFKNNTGVFVVVSPNQDAFTFSIHSLPALQSAYTDGALVTTDWSDVETARGVYDWTYLDTQIAKIATLGKITKIALRTGIGTPQWVYSTGVPAYVSNIQIPRNGAFCGPAIMPYPFDPGFVVLFNEMIAAFGAHYEGNANVVSIKVSAPAARTDEVLYQTGVGQTVSGGTVNQYAPTGTCTYVNDTANMMNAGYTTQKVAWAYNQLVAAYAQAFPTTMLEMQTSSLNSAWPRIGPTGAASTNGNRLGAYLLAPACGLIAGINHCIGAANDWVGYRDSWTINPVNSIDYPIYLAVTTAGMRFGVQEAWTVTNDPTCIMNGLNTPCYPDVDFGNAVTNALSVNVAYAEVFNTEVDCYNNLPSVTTAQCDSIQASLAALHTATRH